MSKKPFVQQVNAPHYALKPCTYRQCSRGEDDLCPCKGMHHWTTKRVEYLSFLYRNNECRMRIAIAIISHHNLTLFPSWILVKFFLSYLILVASLKSWAKN